VRSEIEVGLYGAAYKFMDVLTVVPMMFMALVLPPLTLAWKNQELDRTRYYLQRSFDAMFLLGLPILFGGVLMAKPLIVIVGGTEFATGFHYLQILMLALFAVFMSAIFTHAMIAMNQQKKMIKWFLLDAIVALTCYIIFIPKFGAVAAAWITVLSEAVIALFAFIQVSSITKFRLEFTVALKCLLAAGLMSAPIILWGGQLRALFLIPIAGAVYGAAIFILGAVPRDLLTQALSGRIKPSGN
ncbi:MAG: polysaccharide biosynthesis C-terminal domain-containing protein, partial [bacterium]